METTIPHDESFGLTKVIKHTKSCVSAESEAKGSGRWETPVRGWGRLPRRGRCRPRRPVGLRATAPGQRVRRCSPAGKGRYWKVMRAPRERKESCKTTAVNVVDFGT